MLPAPDLTGHRVPGVISLSDRTHLLSEDERTRRRERRLAALLDEDPTPTLASLDDLESKVDRVVEANRVVEARLDDDVRGALRSSGFTQPVGGGRATTFAERRLAASARGGATTTTTTTTRRRTVTRSAVERAVDERLDPTARSSADARAMEAREERARALAGIHPETVRPAVDPPLVTRGGVFYVAPLFAQARGVGDVGDARLIRAGYRTAESVVREDAEVLAEVTHLPVEAMRGAKRDLDLTRLPGVSREAADLLRYVGVHSVSKLATRDASLLARDLRVANERYRFASFPAVLASEDAVSRLVEAARDLDA